MLWSCSCERATGTPRLGLGSGSQARVGVATPWSRLDAAVLDVALRNDLVSQVARTLDAMDVPFLVASAYSPQALWAEPLLAGARMLGKPTNPAELVAALRGLLA